jgi:hypothetical protein
MTKYRRLTLVELEELKKEFIDFLVINGIVADDWKKMSETNIEKSDLVIDKFSDVIFESSMRKVSYIEFVSEKSIKCFQCLENEITLVGVDAPKDSNINFASDNWKDELNELKIYTQTKGYIKQRELELFDLIKAGASISDGNLFKQLCLAL